MFQSIGLHMNFFENLSMESVETFVLEYLYILAAILCLSTESNCFIWDCFLLGFMQIRLPYCFYYRNGCIRNNLSRATVLKWQRPAAANPMRSPKSPGTDTQLVAI